MITATTKQQHYLKQFAALQFPGSIETHGTCLLYTSDAADDLLCVDLFGRRIIKKNNKK